MGALLKVEMKAGDLHLQVQSKKAESVKGFVTGVLLTAPKGAITEFTATGPGSRAIKEVFKMFAGT